MSSPPLSTVERQVRRASRRLFVQALLNSLVWCWAGALAAAVGWFLLEPLLLPGADGALRWFVAAGCFATGTVVAVLLTCQMAPSRLDAALALDARFGLKERVTTSLSLTPDLVGTPAGAALLADTDRRIASLDVAERFPVGLSWTAALVPAAAAALALVAFLYEPGTGRAHTSQPPKQLTLNPAEIQEKLDRLKKPLVPAWPEDLPKSKELKELEDEWKKLLERPLDPTDKEQVRERVQEMRKIEEKMRDRIADLKDKADRNKDIKDRLKELNRDPKAKRDGPAKDFEDALAKGQMDKAMDELEKLRRKLEDKKLDPDERKALEDQLRDLERQLRRLADMDDLKEKLKQALDKGELAREDFDALMDKLNQEAGDLGDLRDLADALGECLKCLKEGKGDLGKGLEGLKGKLAKLGLKGMDELKDLDAKHKALCEACDAMVAGLVPRNGLGGGGPPGTTRPMGKDAPTGAKSEKQQGQHDPKGELSISGFRRGGTFSRIPAKEVGTTFNQARQEAPEAMERQAVPPDAADLLRGYYENLGGQKSR